VGQAEKKNFGAAKDDR